jgi:phage FluMu gp28-like protein
VGAAVNASSLAHPSPAALSTALAVDDGVPAVLLAYQQEAILLSEQHAFLLIEKSRRTGISYGFAAKAVLTAAPAERPRNVYYLAYNLDMTREFIGYCADFAKAFHQVATAPSEFLFDDGSEKGVKALRIDFPSGKSIVALSSKPRSLRGMQGDVYIDEAAFHDEFREVLKAAMALTMWGGRVVVISTHNGADNAFNEVIQEVREGKLEGHVMRLTLEDALESGLYRRICLRTGETWTPEGEAAWVASLRKRYGDAADEELDVIPSQGSGTYLSRATIERCMTADFPSIRLTCPAGFERQPEADRNDFIDEWLAEHVAPVLARFAPHRRSFFGQDFARSSDLSAIALGQFSDLAVLEERLEIEMRNVPFSAQFRVLCYLCDNMPLFSKGDMDARGNGQQLAEDMQMRFGFDRIEAVMATANTYLTRMPRLKARIDDGTIRMPLSEDGIEDLKLVKLVKGVPMIVDRRDDKADGAKGKRHGDTAIAKMNLVAAADADPGPLEVHVAGERRASIGDGDLTIRTIGFGVVGGRVDALEEM